MTTSQTCGELLDRILALDHARLRPWGEFHGPTVACYFAQHPSAPRAPQDTVALVRFLQRHADDHDICGDGPAMTIHDVSVDGRFLNLTRILGHLITRETV